MDQTDSVLRDERLALAVAFESRIETRLFDSGHGVKPEAGMVLAFCEQTGLSADTVVVVGDNRHDIEMGRNANAGLCVGVLTGTSTRADLESIADIVLDDISGLPEIV